MSHAIITVEGLGKRCWVGAQNDERYTALREQIDASQNSMPHRIARR